MIRGSRIRLSDFGAARKRLRQPRHREGTIIGISSLFGGHGSAFWVVWDGAKHKHLLRADYLEDAARPRIAA